MGPRVGVGKRASASAFDPLAQPDHRERVPPAAARGGDVAPVEFVRRLVRRHTRQLDHYRQELIGPLARCVTVAERLRVSPAKLDAPSLGSLQRQARALADHAPLLLSHCRVDVEHEGVDVRTQLGDDERHLVNHQARDEVHVAAEPI